MKIKYLPHTIMFDDESFEKIGNMRKFKHEKNKMFYSFSYVIILAIKNLTDKEKIIKKRVVKSFKYNYYLTENNKYIDTKIKILSIDNRITKSNVVRYAINKLYNDLNEKQLSLYEYKKILEEK